MRTYEFNYYAPTKVYFGDGAIEHLDEALSQFGKRVLVICGKTSAKKAGIYDYISKMFAQKGYEWYEFTDVQPNPRLSSAIAAANICKEHHIDAIVAIGGGSTIDCSKAASWIALDDDGDPWRMNFAFGAIEKALPVIAIPTMAASGSEMDDGAVITNDEVKVKGSFISEVLIPRVAIIDPKYSYSAPTRQVASGCADIFTHVIENYFNPVDDLYLTDGIIEAILRTVVKYGPVALREPDNFEARANISWAAPWAMNPIVMGGRVCPPTLHTMQAPLGAYYDVTHGEALAILMPHWFRYILSDKTVDRFVKFGVNVFGIDASLDKYEIANKAIEAVEDLFFNKFNIPRKLSDLGVSDKYFDEVAEQILPSAPVLYVPLSKEDILNILRAAL